MSFEHFPGLRLVDFANVVCYINVPAPNDWEEKAQGIEYLEVTSDYDNHYSLMRESFYADDEVVAKFRASDLGRHIDQVFSKFPDIDEMRLRIP
jgi:hypothetical protein